MALTSGTKLGPYEILSPAGAGGMGEVYRARDTRLDRTVAVKVLSTRLADRPDLQKRLEREARTISKLTHPHICTLYDVGQQEGVDFLVMEYLEGETLSHRLQRGPLPVEQTLKYGIEIAAALETAHRQGIIHRDLKPGNVMLTKAGAKLMDFGLAKLAEQPAPVAVALSEMANAPTLPSEEKKLTDEGVVVGTFQYMAPEQLEGKEADARTDLFALGMVLYEMATGRPAFTGRTKASVIAAILSSEPPPISSSQPLTPPELDRVVKTCLAKDPEERFETAHDVKLELKWVAEGGSQAGVPPARRPVLWIAFAVLVTAIAGAALIALRLRSQPSTALPVAKLQLLPPAETNFEAFAVSPDGRSIAFSASDKSGRTQLWIRSLDSVTPRPLPGTEGAQQPFWAPDDRFLAFFTKDKLKRIDVAGGLPQVICELFNNRAGPRGGTWGRDGLILFAVETLGPEDIYQVSATGGEPKPVNTLEPDSGRHHHHWPAFLPNGRDFLYFVAAEGEREQGVYVASLDRSAARLLLRGAQTAAVFAARASADDSDQLLFVRDGTLVAQAFDRQRLQLTGTAVPLAEELGGYGFSPFSGQSANFSISHNGVLAYRPGSGLTQLQWTDRSGAQQGLLGPPGMYIDLRIAPGGNRVAAQREDGLGGADIWLLDVGRGTNSRFTLSSSHAYHAAPVWSPDGSRLSFFVQHDGPWTIYEKSLNGPDEERLVLKSENDQVPLDWTPDGKFLLYTRFAKGRVGSIWALSAHPSAGEQRRSVPVATTEFDQNFGRFSPDGKWVVYVSDESGTREVYVRRFDPEHPGSGEKWQVSSNGGVLPTWPRGDNEIFYIGPDDMLMAVPVKTGVVFEAGAGRPLFRIAPAGVWRYDGAPGGKRILVNAPVEDKGAAATVIINWFEELKRRAN